MITQGHRTPIDHPGTGLLLVIGYYLWKDAAGTGAADEGDDNFSDEDDAPPLTAPAGADADD